MASTPVSVDRINLESLGTACACRDDLAAGLCAVLSRAGNDDPIGTAPSHAHYLLIEVAPPWAHEIAESRRFPAALRAAAERAGASGVRFRLIAVEPDPEYSRAGQTRVISLRRPNGPFAAYDREEFVVPDDQLGALVEALLLRPDELPCFGSWRENTATARDLLVCTHGSRDTCCGKFGYPLYRELRDRYAPAAGGQLRVWRASHIGGHRFAPTLIDFPEGRYWAHLTPEVLGALVRRDAPPATLRRHYRGWGGLDDATVFAQIAEREVLMGEGWDAIAYPKTARALAVDERGEGATVRLDYSAPDGRQLGAYEVTIQVCGHARLATCREPAAEPRTIPQYRVTGVVRVSTATAGAREPAWRQGTPRLATPVGGR